MRVRLANCCTNPLARTSQHRRTATASLRLLSFSGKTDSASHGFFVTQRLCGLLWHLEYSEIMIYVFYEHLLP